MVEYKEQDLLGGWSIAVLLNGIPVGHIRPYGQDDGFAYYEGQHNHLNSSFQDRDLGSLKRRIEATVA